MTSFTAPSSSTLRRRPPVAVIAVVVIVGLRSAFGVVGLVYFGLFVTPDVNPDAGSPPAVAFAAVGLVLTLTGLASLPGLWRGRRIARHVLTCVVTAGVYFGCYKILAEGEGESVVFLAVDLVEGALLLLPVTLRHVGA